MSSFGEIVEPTTRTAFEDWDEIIEHTMQLHLAKTNDDPKIIDTFLLFEGRYLFAHIKSQHDLEEINSIPEVNLKLYKTKKANNYVCLIRDYNIVLSSEIIELLKPYITISTNVIAILTKPIVEYQVPELVTRDYVIRALYTSKPISKSLDINFPKLEQPNIVSGVTAGVISLREILGLSAVVIVCYFEHPADQNILELNKLLEKFHVMSQSNTEGNNLLNSNLYI